MDPQLVMLVILMVVMFAVMIIPQKKREKQKKQMLSSLQAGDKIRTIGGIIGKVAKVDDEKQEILIYTGIVGNPAERSMMRFALGAVETVIKKGNGSKAEVEDTDAIEEAKEAEAEE